MMNRDSTRWLRRCLLLGTVVSAVVVGGACAIPPADDSSEGEGEGEGEAGLTVEPLICDFGIVAVGGEAFCDVVLRNTSTQVVLVTNDGTSQDGVVFAPVRVAVPFSVAAASSTTVRLAAHPVDASLSVGTYLLEVLGRAEPLSVPLRVQGRTVTTCSIGVAREDGAVVVGDAVTAPLEQLTLSAEVQLAAENHPIVAYAWTIEERSADGLARLSTPTSSTTDVVADSAGSMTVGLTVTDDLGATSDCQRTIDVRPSQTGVFVQLTWDSDAADVALHLVRNGTDWCSVDDCYPEAPTRDWGGGDRDPQHAGTGPQTITIPAPDDGDYTVGVGALAGANTTATARVFVAGQLEYEGFAALAAGETWQPARIEISAGDRAVVELDDHSLQAGACWAP